MLAVACSAHRRPEEVSISERDVTWRTVKVELLSSSNNYPRDSIVSYMRLLL